jgi:hypothetical protein
MSPDCILWTRRPRQAQSARRCCHSFNRCIEVQRDLTVSRAERPLTIALVPVDSPEDLYGLPLDRFVASRAALVKALRTEKRREQASEVAALRKPSVAAWAVNQLVRTEPKAVQALFDSGDDLARAQDQAAAGKGGGDAMRTATHRQREAVRELVEAAERLLSSEGQAVSPATTERVGETLRAAANDEDARRQVAGGCLTRELRLVGLGISGLAASSVESDRSAPEPPASRDAEADRVAASERAAALKAARRTEAEAGRAATRADQELAAARARRVQAAAALEEAETLLAAAARRAEDAAAKLAAAEQALKDLVAAPGRE